MFPKSADTDKDNEVTVSTGYAPSINQEQEPPKGNNLYSHGLLNSTTEGESEIEVKKFEDPWFEHLFVIQEGVISIPIRYMTLFGTISFSLALLVSLYDRGHDSGDFIGRRIHLFIHDHLGPFHRPGKVIQYLSPNAWDLIILSLAESTYAEAQQHEH